MLFKYKYSFIIGTLFLVGILFMYGCTNSKTETNSKFETPKVVGVDTFSGVVVSVETIENNVFLVVGKDTAFYASTDSDVAKEVLKLKVGNMVDIKYVLGTPKKYKEQMAKPLSNVKVKK